MDNPFLALLYSFFIREWCAQVIEAPEEIKIIVLRSGTLIGLKLTIEIGGHICPISMFGLNEK